MNRPKKKAADRRSVLIAFRVTKAEHKAMKAAAKKAGKSFSAWVRGKVMEVR